MAVDRVNYYNEKLLAHGVRLTPQRMMVLDVLAGTPGHITAERVLAAVQARYPYVNKTTVYRTLDLLGELGLVATAAGEAGQEYELVDERHHHLICKRCGYQSELPDSTLNPLRDLIEREHGFQPVFDHFTLFGICAACR